MLSLQWSKREYCTASNVEAEAEYTVAVHKELFDDYKGKQIKIEGIEGVFEVQNKHWMKNKQLIDALISDFKNCLCSNEEYDIYNRSNIKITLLD